MRAPGNNEGTDDFRAEIVRDLESCLPVSQRGRNVFRSVHIDDLVHWITMYKRRTWTEAAIIEARRDPVFITYGFRDYFGRRAPRRPWSIMGCMIAAHVLIALRGAGQIRRGYGAVDGPIIIFVHKWLAWIVGDRAPSHEQFFRMPSHEMLLRTLERIRGDIRATRRRQRLKLK
jgi:hypothetical protein